MIETGAVTEIRKPFHEVVVDMIECAQSHEIPFIIKLLRRTIIPKGHAEIISALEARCAVTGWSKNAIKDVTESILEHQKQLEASKAEKGTHKPYGGSSISE